MVVLRLVKPDDLQAMTDYANQLSKEDTFVSLSGEQFTLEEEKKHLDSFLDKMKKQTGLLLVAFVNDMLVGITDLTCLERRSKHVGKIGLSIKKEYRGEGIGKEMLVSLCELAKQMDLRMVELGCFANNTSACALYKKVGFVEVGRIPEELFYKGEYVDCLMFAKKL